MKGVMLPYGTRDMSKTKLWDVIKTRHRHQIETPGVNAVIKAASGAVHPHNSDDYVKKAHPLVFGYGCDRAALFGVYDELSPLLVY